MNVNSVDLEATADASSAGMNGKVRVVAITMRKFAQRLRKLTIAQDLLTLSGVFTRNDKIWCMKVKSSQLSELSRDWSRARIKIVNFEWNSSVRSVSVLIVGAFVYVSLADDSDSKESNESADDKSNQRRDVSDEDDSNENGSDSRQKRVVRKSNESKDSNDSDDEWNWTSINLELNPILNLWFAFVEQSAMNYCQKL